jgi:response regulator RpfG family c-di-GMP phosphodiesterase
MAEMRDPKETGAHVTRVGAVAAEIYDAWASRSGAGRTDIDHNKDILRMASMLHDVGKVAISDVILKKPARLSDNEFNIMKQHTFLGARLFADSHSEFDEAAFHIALEHHERWDGTGYPGAVDVRAAAHGELYLPQHNAAPKKGAGIHPFARIVAIADVFDALSSQRCYKEAWQEEQVLATIRSESGRRFDPEMVDSFFSALDGIRTIMQQYPDTHLGRLRSGALATDAGRPAGAA